MSRPVAAPRRSTSTVRPTSRAASSRAAAGRAEHGVSGQEQRGLGSTVPGAHVGGADLESRSYSGEIQAARYQRLDPAEPGLVAYYPLDERDSTLAHDVSPGGSMAGCRLASAGEGAPADYVPRSPPQTALLFNGTDTYLQLPTVTADFSAGLTFEAWVYFDNVAKWSRIFEISNGPLADNLIWRANVSPDLNFSSCRGDL